MRLPAGKRAQKSFAAPDLDLDRTINDNLAGALALISPAPDDSCLLWIRLRSQWDGCGRKSRKKNTETLAHFTPRPSGSIFLSIRRIAQDTRVGKNVVRRVA